MSIVSEVVGSAVVAAIVSGLFGIYTVWRSSENSKGIEALKSRLKQAEDRSKTQFDWLHQRRAEVAVEVYGLLTELNFLVFSYNFQQIFSTAMPDVEMEVYLVKDISRAQRALYEAFTRRALLLPEDVVSDLNTLYPLLVSAFTKMHSTENGELVSGEHPDSRSTKSRIDALRARLRVVFGSVEQDAREQSLQN